ncbi:MAG: nucleoside monophosphate kinase, partial [Sedimenticolaceae bacterium]
MRIVLLGPPGSGKGALSQQLSEHYGMPVITVGSVMRRAAAEQTELGRLAKEAMDMSRVSDELLLALLRIQMPQMDLSKGFI